VSANQKQRWAARLARRRARTARPAPKPKKARTKREPRELTASPTAAADIQEAFFGPRASSTRSPDAAAVLALAALSTVKTRRVR
jgi:hypothetical protein